jgi:hypothetical protein
LGITVFNLALDVAKNLQNLTKIYCQRIMQKQKPKLRMKVMPMLLVGEEKRAIYV